MITADLCIIPMGIEDSSVGEYVGKAVKIIEKSGLNYQITAMGTQIETDDLKRLYEVCAEVQEAIFNMGVGRVYTVLKIDDRRDRENRTLEEKVKSVKNRMEWLSSSENIIIIENFHHNHKILSLYSIFLN